MISQWYAEHFGTYPNSLILALIVIAVVAVLALIFVAVARGLDRRLPDETATEEDAIGRRWTRLPRISNR
jgi:hypothetical protein